MIDFNKISAYYDDLYVDEKEYQQECKRIVDINSKYNKSNNDILLDIGCGTGIQTKNLSRYFSVTGIDLSDEMLKIAAENVKMGNFLKKDMFDFTLNNDYGIVINLFGSISFANNYGQMVKGLRCVWNCLAEGGILILTPWSTKETFSAKIIPICKKTDRFVLCCLENVKRLNDGKMELEMHHLVGVAGIINHYYYSQIISLFSEREYLMAIKEAGFKLLARLSEQDFRMGAFICGKRQFN